MKLIKLELANFRQHQQFDYDFQAGITAVLGPNGCGKSSLVEAIAFVLYGPAVIRGTLEELKTFSAPKTAAVTAKLQFEHANVIYRIERSATSAKLFKAGDNNFIANGSRAVTLRVTELLGMNYQEFLAAYYTEQKSLEFLAGQKGSTEREKFVLRLLGYDRLEKAHNLLKEDRKLKRQELTAHQTLLGDRESYVSKELAAAQHVRTVQANLNSLATALAEADLVFQSKSKLYAKAKQAREKFLELKQNLAVLQSEEQIRKTEIANSQSELNEAELANSNFSLTKLEQFKSEDLSRQAELEQQEKKFNQLKQLAHEKQTEQRLQIKNTTERATLVEQNLRKLNSLGASDNCPTCQQELGSSYLSYQANLQAELAQLNDLESSLNHNWQNVNAGFCAEIDKLSQHLQSDKQVHLNLQTELKNLQVQQLQLENIQKLKAKLIDLKKSLTIVQTKIESNQSAITNLNFSEESFQALNATYESTQSLVNISRLQKVKAEGDLQLHKALHEQAKEELAKHDQQLRSFAQLQKDASLLERADQQLTNYRKQLNADLKPRLAEVASDFLTEITEGRYSEVKIDESFEAQIVSEQGVLSVISGGEQDILHLAMRLALSSMLFERSGHAFSLLILDEIFGSLDENRRSNVLALLERLGSHFDQVLIITHVEEIKDWVHNCINLDYDSSSYNFGVS